MSENPWKKHSTESVYENDWIRVDKSKVTMPNNEPGDYTVVHFKSLAVGCVPVDNQGNIYLVGQWRFPFDKYYWELPMGGASFDKDPVAECKRELKEETGIVASEWKELLRMETSNSVTDETAIMYMCLGLEFGPPEPEPCEKLQVRRVTFDQALKMVMDGEITDGLSIAAIMKLAILTKTY